MKFFFLLSAVVALIAGCHSGQNPQKADSIPAGIHKVMAEEILQTTEYTYLRVKEGESEFWLAVSKTEAVVGGIYYYQGGLPMENFESKELKKTFKEILFLDDFGSKPDFSDIGSFAASHHGSDSTSGANKENNLKQDIRIEPVSNGISIAELFKNKSSFSGKTVRIRGKVTKYSTGIMDKNWIHLQDGTDYSGDYDLTVTSQEEVVPGDTITMEGLIVLDRDFGFGYTYSVIMEAAKLVK